MMQKRVKETKNKIKTTGLTTALTKQLPGKRSLPKEARVPGDWEGQGYASDDA
jgi:hypothetical protein